MSSSIWTQCAGASEIRALRLMPWRAVEGQHEVSTRKLVANAQEQALLEELIDRAKPPDLTRGRLHYLLATPFRYPPLRWGSRFGTRQEQGIWYGSETRDAMFAEVAYYRFVFLEGTRADLGMISTHAHGVQGQCALDQSNRSDFAVICCAPSNYCLASELCGDAAAWPRDA